MFLACYSSLKEYIREDSNALIDDADAGWQRMDKIGCLRTIGGGNFQRVNMTVRWFDSHFGYFSKDIL